MMKKIVLSFFLSTLFIYNLHAEISAKYASEFFYLGAGSRMMGMAGAGTAMANDVSAGYWNPAGLVSAQGFQAELMHSKQFIASIQNNFLAFSNKRADGSVLAFSVLYLTINNIKDSQDAYDELQNKVDFSLVNLFNTGDYTFLFSYANWYRDDLSYGLNAKAIYRDLYAETAFGIGFDAALKYFPYQNLQVGLVLRDITTTMITWSSGRREFIRPSIRLGTTYAFHLPFWELRLQPAADFLILFENRQTASQYNLGAMSFDTFWGMEVDYANILSIRMGLDDLQRFNAGMGVKIPKLSFHYSFTPDYEDLGNIQRISVHLQLDSLF